ncbi:WD40/YVTN/BNR-like repeat-containing protein [Catellatospora coxensis]
MRPLLLTALGLALVTACTPRGEASGPSPAAPPPGTAASPPARAVVQERTADVGVPPDYHPFVEFADARNGYAVFTDCGGSGTCRGRLFATADAGATWQARPMPLAEDESIQLYVVGPKQMMIWGDRAGGYHLSRDGGLTFTFSPTVPAGYHAATGVRYGVDYAADEPVLRDWQTGRPVPLPGGYQGAGAVATPDGAIWLTTLEPRKETARSVDGGRTWQRLAVPDQPGRKLWMLSVRVSPPVTRGWSASRTCCPPAAGRRCSAARCSRPPACR